MKKIASELVKIAKELTAVRLTPEEQRFYKLFKKEFIDDETLWIEHLYIEEPLLLEVSHSYASALNSPAEKYRFKTIMRWDKGINGGLTRPMKQYSKVKDAYFDLLEAGSSPVIALQPLRGKSYSWDGNLSVFETVFVKDTEVTNEALEIDGVDVENAKFKIKITKIDNKGIHADVEVQVFDSGELDDRIEWAFNKYFERFEEY